MVIKISNVEVYGWEAAIRGMRSPMESWDKSDSFKAVRTETPDFESDATVSIYEKSGIGPSDLRVMKMLSKAGDDHGKFLRMITVTADILAPRYWWPEYDTYKVGTVANSCSTMHKIHAKEFTLSDFSWEQLSNTGCSLFESESDNGLFKSKIQPLGLLWDYIIPSLNVCREKYLETKDKQYWWQMIQLLPQSYNQLRTVQLNYQVLKNMYHARKAHKLDEWHDFCAWCETLPYFREVCIEVANGQ